jgi:hypothetical protein
MITLDHALPFALKGHHSSLPPGTAGVYNASLQGQSQSNIIIGQVRWSGVMKQSSVDASKSFPSDSIKIHRRSSIYFAALSTLHGHLVIDAPEPGDRRFLSLTAARSGHWH